MSVSNSGLPSSVVISNDYTHHHEYFISSGDFFILVRNILFRVCSYFLIRDSGFWRDPIEKLYSSNDAPGSSELRPFFLDEDPDEVAQFLSIPYTRRYNIYDQTPDQWGALFRLADKWNAPGMRDLAISKIQSAPMGIVELRLFLEYNVPREVYYPLIEVLAYRDELPEDLLPIFIGGTSLDDVDSIPGGVEIPQAPPPSLEGSDMFPMPSVSTEFTASEGSSHPPSISEDENVSPLPASSVPNIPSDTCVEAQEVIVDQLPSDERGVPKDLQEEGIADDFPPNCGDWSDQWVMVEGNQNDDQSLSHPSARRPLMMHDFIIPYCLFVSIISAMLA